jgi:hypothetical protein
MSRERAREFGVMMDLVGGALVFVREHAAKRPTEQEWKRAHKIPVTRGTRMDGTFPFSTHAPLIAYPLKDQWINLLPETGLRSDTRAMTRVAPDVVQVTVVDMQWGRPMWLFKTAVDVLAGRGPDIPKSKRT